MYKIVHLCSCMREGNCKEPNYIRIEQMKQRVEVLFKNELLGHDVLTKGMVHFKGFF